MALGVMICSATISKAVDMGTTFTYQGRLIDANSAADDLYDLQFKLFDDPNIVIGNQIGSDVNVPDTDVIDGHFTVALDFNDANAFNGDSRWLEICVRPGELGDPNVYTVLSPRQEIKPTPYALYAASGTPGPQGPQGEQGPPGPEGLQNDSARSEEQSQEPYGSGRPSCQDGLFVEQNCLLGGGLPKGEPPGECFFPGRPEVPLPACIQQGVSQGLSVSPGTGE